MDRPWWQSMIQWPFWTFVTSLVIGWLARSRLKPRSSDAANKLHHPISTLILGCVGFLFFAALTVISNVIPNETTTWWTTSTFVGFALLSFPLILDYFRARHELTESGIVCGRLFLPRLHIAWKDVKRVKYAPYMKWFKIETRSGEVGQISAMLIGLPEFAQAILSHVSPDAIVQDTLPILEATASGNPPSL